MKIVRPQTKSKKERRKKKRKIIIFTLLFLIFFITLVWFVHRPQFKISKIIIHGNKTVLESSIREEVEKNLEKNILWVFPQNTIFFVRPQKIAEDIENSFPKIYSADVRIENKSELLVHIEERKPHSLWCKNREEGRELFFDQCYFADQRGFIYEEAPYFSDGIFEKIYTTDNLLKIGEQVMDKEDFNTFFHFTQILSDRYAMSIDKIVMNDKDEVKLYIHSFLGENFIFDPYLVYKNTESYELLINNIELMVGHQFFKKEFEKHPKHLKFIDLRIKDQIRFKFYSDEEWNRLLEEQEKENNDKNNTEKRE